MIKLLKRLILWAGSPETTDPSPVNYNHVDSTGDSRIDPLEYTSSEESEDSVEDVIVKILAGKAIAAKTTFERLVLATYMSNKQALHKYPINIGNDSFVALRIASGSKGAVFLRESSEQFYYLEYAEKATFDVLRGYDSTSDFETLIVDYLAQLNSDNEYIIAVNEALEGLKAKEIADGDA